MEAPAAIQADPDALLPEPAVVSQQAGAPMLSAGFDNAGDEIDDEIREIFLEEFEEEIGNLNGLLIPWRRAPDDGELLRPIRRVFHTLKGSGRLVGAKTLGEFSWHVENMLNRVLDGSRPASQAVVAFIGQTSEVLPHLHAALRGEAAVSVDLAAMEAVADRLAAGEDVLLGAVVSEAPAEVAEARAPEAPTLEVPVAETVAVQVDPVLLEILGTEVGGHLETVDAWLLQARAGDGSVNDGLLRAIHTLNGAFAMTEVPSVTAFTSPAEGYVKRLLAAGLPADEHGVDMLGAVADAVRASTKALQATPAQVPVYAALATSVAGLRDTLPEATLPFISAADMEREAAQEGRRGPRHVEQIGAASGAGARPAAGVDVHRRPDGDAGEAAGHRRRRLRQAGRARLGHRPVRARRQARPRARSPRDQIPLRRERKPCSRCRYRRSSGPCLSRDP